MNQTWTPIGENLFRMEIRNHTVDIEQIDESVWVWKLYHLGDGGEEIGQETSPTLCILAAEEAVLRVMPQGQTWRFDADGNPYF